MQAFLDAISVLHVLRPWFLIAIPVILGLWWNVRNPRAQDQDAASGIAPHLAEALTVGSNATKNLQPIDGIALALCLGTLAAAGPTWSRVPNPFLSQTAPLVVALEVSESMTNPDVSPSRLERARFKIQDLVGRRAGASTALVAYGGTAHRVAPLTDDPNILKALLEGLSPEIMPSAGQNATAALDLARAELARVQTPGAILLVLDGLDDADVAAFSPISENQAPVIVLFAAPENVSQGALAQLTNVKVVPLSVDDTDLDQIERAAAAAYRASLLGDDRLDWDDRGWMFGWPAMLILLLWFRRGWTMRWIILLGLASTVMGPQSAQADVADWFLTPDQQGMLAYHDKRFDDAGELFVDPMWRAYAKYRAGQYPEAAEMFARIDTASAAMGEGMSRIRNREYRPAIAAYERALELQPDFPEAQHNLEVAKYTLEYVETAREQGDTGEEAGLGADDVVFDNEAERGAETVKDYAEKGPEFQSTEQWMRSVDTNMADFLKSRFLLEAAGAQK
ncbi:VWA domain-containing protein [Shimia litoralis]|uniref:VWA domain-containing protein n=1 Tax=Shimia litoralis TaxID=420403 RepID=A0A4U7N165_9RHOB|nr:VWA domain-containing protein [Shimia litoralis]TKZ19208.1 VWA domain-containing protein [Shimia litoralis]